MARWRSVVESRGRTPVELSEWMDASEVDARRPGYPSRLVAKEIEHDKREDLFAATRPLEAKKLLFTLRASTDGMCSDLLDVVRAYLHAKARRKMYVELP